jgi:hypothetical protein
VNDSKYHEILVHRILSGKQVFVCNDITYELRKPSLSLKISGDILYTDAYESNLYNEFWFLEDIEHLLFELQILPWDYKKIIEKIEKSLESSKITLYQQYFDSTKRNKTKQKIQNLKKDLEQFLHKQHCLDYITLEHYCDNIRNEFLITNTLYEYNTDNLIFYNDNIDYNSFNSVASKISQNLIDISTFKALARSEYWRNYWNNNKSNILDDSVKEWSEEQKSLINISYMYDKIYEHPECPQQDIINDDDALDGWMLFNKRENERQKKQKGVENVLSGNLKNASEVFLMAGNNQQADDILGLNNNEGLSILRQKVDFVTKTNAGNRVPDAQLPDVQQRIVQQLNSKG